MTSRLFHFLVCIALLIISAGCTTVTPFRTNLITGENVFNKSDPQCGEKPEKNLITGVFEPCRLESVERTEKYKLFFIEFDEQGRLFDRRQLTALSDYLLRIKKNGSPAELAKNKNETDRCTHFNSGASIVTFVHGWRNNADYHNDNVKLARDILKLTSAGENAGIHFNPSDCPRAVVGVYVGWRGLSTSSPKAIKDSAGLIWEGASAWDRKNTAQNVAIGSVRELFSLLKVFQDESNYQANPPGHNNACSADSTGRGNDIRPSDIYHCRPVRHLIVGHSFGALIVNNAVSQQLLESVTRGMFVNQIEDKDYKPCDEPNTLSNDFEGRALVRSYADLIILLNPAVEGARYEPLHEAVNARALKAEGKDDNERRGAFCPNQKPVLVVLSSENDKPNAKLFPLLRWFSTLFENSSPRNSGYSDNQQTYLGKEESSSSIKTMGLNKRYHTHELTSWETFYKNYPFDTIPSSNLTPSQLAILKKQQKDAQTLHFSCIKSPLEDPLDEALRNSRCLTTEAAKTADKNKAIEQNTSPQISPTSTKLNSLNQPIDSKSCKAFVDEVNLARELKGTPVNGWSITFGGGSTLRHLPNFEGEASDIDTTKGEQPHPDVTLHTVHSPTSPVWNIYVREPTIIDGHNDIASTRLLWLLPQIYHSVVLKSFDPTVLEKFEQLARNNFKEKCIEQKSLGLQAVAP